MKKILCLAVLLLVLLPACVPQAVAPAVQEKAAVEEEAPAAQEGDASGEVDFFHRFTGSSQEGLQAMFAVCLEQNPDIELDEASVPADQYEVQLPIALSSDTPPDIYALWSGGRAIFQAENGRILNITEVYNEKVAPNLFDGINEGVTESDGTIYVYSYNVQPNAFYYNKPMFDELNLEEPETWEEFLVVLETIKESGTTPITLGSIRGWEPLFWFDYLVLRLAGPEFREDLMWGRASYTDPKVIQVMEMWGELLEAGYFNEDITSLGFPDMTAMIADGSAAMMLMGPWTINNLKDAGLTPGVDFDLFPFPVIDSEIPLATEGAMAGLALSGAGGNTEGALQLLSCLSSTEAQKAYAAKHSVPMTNPNVPIETYPEGDRDLLTEVFALNEHSFHQNLELATIPPVTDVAKREFPRFLTFPDQYMTVLEQLDKVSQEEFGE